MSQPKLFKYRHFEPEIIVLYVRWYLRYSLSYRNLEEMMAEHGLGVDHTTIYRIPVGPTLCPDPRKALPSKAEADQRLLARRRNVHKGQRNVVVSLPGRRFGREQRGVHAFHA